MKKYNKIKLQPFNILKYSNFYMTANIPQAMLDMVTNILSHTKNLQLYNE